MTGAHRPVLGAGVIQGPVPWVRRGTHRIAFAAAAFLVADLIVGATVFSVMTLGILGYFAFEWIQLAQLAAHHGLSFGTPYQVRMAEGTLAVTPLAAGWVLYLGAQAVRLPRAIWSSGRPRTSMLSATGLVAMRSPGERGSRHP